MDLLKIIFILTLFLFPLGEIVRINLGNNIFLKPLDIGIALTAFFYLLLKFKRQEPIKQKSILIPIFLFAGIGFFSLIINSYLFSFSQFLASFLYLVRWLGYALLFFVVTDFSKEFKKEISNFLVIIGSLIVGFGYLQYFLYPSLRNLFYAGWDEHMYRMFSVFLDPNFAGVFFVLFLLYLANLFLKKKTASIGLILLFTLGAVFLTFSRTALIMLITSFSLFFILINKKIWIPIFLTIIILVLFFSSRYFNIENINLFRIASSEARLETAKNAIAIIQKHPFFGVGFNSYRYAQIRYGFRNEKSPIVSHADAGADNSFLFAAATTGLVGFGFFIFLWFRILKLNLKYPLVLSSVAGVFISSLFINSLFYSGILMWIWVIFALKENK